MIRPTGRWTCWPTRPRLAKVQESVFFAVATLLNLEVDFLLFDTTSTYWECDTEDPETDDGTTGLRRYGHSNEAR